MLVNLDPWIKLSNWNWTAKSQTKGVEVIDNCLKVLPVMAPQLDSPKPSPTRKRYPNPKYREYVFVDKPSGYCPKCTKYVRDGDEGVVCIKCNAYLHYECANTTQEELDEKWLDKPFQCIEHRSNGQELVLNQGNPQAYKFVEDAYNDENLLVRNIKIKDYSLNGKAAIKKKLNALNGQTTITGKDGNRQQVVIMSTPTYHIMMENLISCGEKMGLEVKREDIDEKGNNVESYSILLSLNFLFSY